MARRLLVVGLQMMLGGHNTKSVKDMTGRGGRVARARRAARRAFTLVELMIVVAIVGVLSIIAVVGYRKLVLSGKVTEAKNVISGVRLAQEEYKTERGVYANIGPALCPNASAGTTQVKIGWDTSCSGGPGTWAMLPFHADGPVQFGYSTVAGTTSPPGNIGQPTPFVTVPGTIGTNPWYYVTASADLDGTGGKFTELVGTSWQNTIFTFQEGE
jgi:type IV pilus assembly protein PilA